MSYKSQNINTGIKEVNIGIEFIRLLFGVFKSFQLP